MPDKLVQPRLNASFSAPALAGVEDGRTPGYPPEGTITRPGRNQKPVTGNSASLGQSANLALFGSPSYSSIFVEPQDLEPGPGTYDIHPCIGQQLLSTKESTPAVSLTAKHDRAWSRVMITKEHNDIYKARDTPGPGTYKPQEVATHARVRFGTSKRKPISDSSFKAPGPVYEVRTTPDSPLAQIKFGKADRFSQDGVSLASQLEAAGPGQYEVSTVFDGVNLAKSFGASHRAYDSVRFPGGDRAFAGRNSPGPGSLRPLYNDSVSMSFGRAERLPTNNSSKRAPGPGAYENHERKYPFSRNMSSYSFGKPHARGRLDWKQMRELGNNSTWGVK